MKVMKGYLNILKNSIEWFVYGLKAEFEDYKDYNECKENIISLKKICTTNKEMNALLDKMLIENEHMYKEKQKLVTIIKGGIGTLENAEYAKKILDDIDAINKKMGNYHHMCVDGFSKKV